MSNLKIFSDAHAFHNNIIKYCDRPTTVELHNEWILDTINESVKPGDTGYHLGDLVGSRRGYKYADLLNFMKQLNGSWKFIKGNHDDENQLKSLCKESGHEYCGLYLEETFFDKRNFIMFHFPIESWHKKNYGSIHLHGHIHNTRPDTIVNRYNVCLDKEHRVFDLEEFDKDNR